MRDRGPGARLALLAAGLVGPFILVGSFMFRFGLGLDAPWYLAELVAIDYVSIVAFVLVLCWLAGAAQLTAIATGRYAPYPLGRRAAAARPDPQHRSRGRPRPPRAPRIARATQKALEL